MQSDNRLLDDLARVLSGAMGATAGIRADMEARLRDPLERVIERLDLVTREEFEVVREMAELAREQQEVLQARIEDLEAEVAALTAAQSKGTRKSSSTKAAPAKSKDET
ncbi:MAG: accessory factor UbiK family protein [Pseudomonadota bacterium]